MDDPDKADRLQSCGPCPSTSAASSSSPGRCEACPFKKMRLGSDEDGGRAEGGRAEGGRGQGGRAEGGRGLEAAPVEMDCRVQPIGETGIYALARAENSNENNNAVTELTTEWCPESTRKKTSPLKNYDDDTRHLPGFRELLQDGSTRADLFNGTCDRTASEKPTCAAKCTAATFHCNASTSTNCSVNGCHSDDSVTTTQLPMTILVNIFQYLPMSDLLCRAGRVCRLWYHASHDPSLWRHICLPVSSRVTDDILYWMTSLSDRVLTIDVSGSKHTSFSDEGVMQILEKCRHLRTLKLARYFVFSDDVFECVGRCCHLVRHLNLDGCFSISDTSVIQIGKGCPQLEYLYMSQCNRISDDGMLAIARGCPKLKQLRIDQCVKVKNVSLQALVAGCPDLEYLHLLACSLTDDGLQDLCQLCHLRMLDISNMTQLSSACLERIARSCKELEVLSVSLNRTVDDACIRAIVQSCVHLKCLSCVACNLTDKTLEYIGQYSRTVERVDVAWCGEITDHGVRAVSRSCVSLRYLGLMRCGKVTMETVDELIPVYPHIHYSNFVLESRKLLQRAHNDGHMSLVDETVVLQRLDESHRDVEELL